MAFHSGQHVVCIDDKNWLRDDGRSNHPIKGVVYTIRGIEPSLSAVSLMEFNKNHFYLARRFRPLQKLDIEDFIPAEAPRETEPA